MNRRLAVALFLVATAAGILTRFHAFGQPRGARFYPWPGGVELVAQAQAIEQWGRVFLQVGPEQVRPRYSAGWPLVLAGALRVGVGPTDLWRVAAVLGGLLSGAIGVAAFWVVRSRRPEALLAPALGGLTAGLLWATAPLAVTLGGTVMNDEPAAAFAVFALLAAYLARSRASWGLVAGLLWGLTLGVRPIVALLVAPSLALVLGRPKLRTLAALCAGGAIVPLLLVVLQARSGWPLFSWSGYDFWLPGRYGPGAETFALRNAFSPPEDFAFEIGGRQVGHLEAGLRAMLGVPGLDVDATTGLLWPALGWLLCFAVGSRTARIAAGLWALLHLVFFAFYFFPATRFYLAPLTIPAVAVGVAVARVRWRVVAAVAAGVLIASNLATLQSVRKMRGGRLHAELEPRVVRRWLALDDAARAGRVMPFDPVQAQAMGLLPPAAVASIGEWGELPYTIHTLRLRGAGGSKREER